MAKKNKSAQVDDIIVTTKKKRSKKPTQAEIEESLKKGRESATADFKAAEARAKKDGRSVYGKDPEGNYYVSANIRKARKRRMSGAVEPGMTPMDLLGGGASLAGILGLGGKAALKAAAKGSLKEVASKARREAVGRAGKLSRKRKLKQERAQKQVDRPTHVDRLVEAQEHRAGTASVGRMAGGRHANVRGPNAPLVKTKKGPNYKAQKSAKDARERAGRPMSQESIGIKYSDLGRMSNDQLRKRLDEAINWSKKNNKSLNTDKDIAAQFKTLTGQSIKDLKSGKFDMNKRVVDSKGSEIPVMGDKAKDGLYEIINLLYGAM